MKRLLLIMMLSLGSLFMTTTASAADFTFEVNVDVHDVPTSIDSVGLTCKVYYDAGNTVLGQHTIYQPISAGRFRGMLRVDVNVSRPPSATAGHYRCSLYGMRDGRAIAFDTISNPASPIYEEEFARQAGAQITVQANGPL
jgi:hypothetical protein